MDGNSRSEPFGIPVIDSLRDELGPTARRPAATTVTPGAVLVGFEVCDGPIGGWTQRGCAHTEALPALRCSALRFQPFADRAAQLAAALSSPG